MKQKRTAGGLGALLAFALIAGLLAGCANPLEFERKATLPGSAPGSTALPGSTEEPGQGLHLVLGISNGRTILPTSPTITKYEVNFAVALDGAGGLTGSPGTQGAYAGGTTGAYSGNANTVNITSGTTTYIPDLPYGPWDVTVRGYAQIDTDLAGTLAYREVASGTAWVNYSASNATVTVTIKSAVTTGSDPGYFAWNLNLTGLDAATITSGSAKLYPYSAAGDYDAGTSSVGAPLDINLLSSAGSTVNAASGAQAVIASPGYYYLKISMANGYQTRGWADVVHIYSNLTTTASYTISDSDFAVLADITGTVDATTAGPGAANDELFLLKNGQIISRQPLNTTAAVGATTFNFKIPVTMGGGAKFVFYKGGTATIYGLTNSDVTLSGATLAIGSPLVAAPLSAVISSSPKIPASNGAVGTALPGSQNVSIALTGSWFNRTGAAITAAKVANGADSWVTNLPAGLHATVTGDTDTQLILTFSGTPTAASTQAIAITLPANVIIGRGTTLTLTPNAGALFDIQYNLSQGAITGASGVGIKFTSDALGATVITRAKNGDTVYVYGTGAGGTGAIPAGKRFKQFVWKNLSNNAETTVDIAYGQPTYGSFTMPGAHVQVAAVFEDIPQVSINFVPAQESSSYTLTGDGATLRKSYHDSITVTLGGADPDKYQVQQVFIDGSSNLTVGIGTTLGKDLSNFTLTTDELETLLGGAGSLTATTHHLSVVIGYKSDGFASGVALVVPFTTEDGGISFTVTE